MARVNVKSIVKLPEGALQDMQRIVSHADALKLLVDSLPKLANLRGENEIVCLVKEKTGLDERAVGELLAGIRAVVAFRDFIEEPPDSAYDLLTRGIDLSAPSEWKSKYQAPWVSSKPLITKLLEPDSPLAIFWKSQALQLAYPQVWLSGSIFTDVRPTFSSAGTEVLRGTVMHTLAITYRSGGRQDLEFHVTLDRNDLKELEELVHRAVLKSSALANSLKCWPLEGGTPSEPT